MTATVAESRPAQKAVAPKALRYPPRVLSGIQPTLHLHLGHYLGAIQHQIDLHHEYPFRTFCLIADYHALVRRLEPDAVRDGVVAVATAYLAFGLDPVKAYLFRQSDVQAICELAWILSTLTPFGAVGRMPTFKQPRDHEQTAALLHYPILQAADILAMRATIIPAGRDQKLHIELTENLADRFNKHVERAVFPIPKSRLSNTSTVKGTDGNKMHTGAGNQIELFKPYHYIKDRVNSIRTEPVKKGEPIDPDKCTIFHLLSLLCDETKVAQYRADYTNGTISYSAAKEKLVLAILDKFKPFEARYHDLNQKPDFVRDVLSEGFRTAKREAADVLEIVRELVGLRGLSRVTGNR